MLDYNLSVHAKTENSETAHGGEWLSCGMNSWSNTVTGANKLLHTVVEVVAVLFYAVGAACSLVLSIIFAGQLREVTMHLK